MVLLPGTFDSCFTVFELFVVVAQFTFGCCDSQICFWRMMGADIDPRAYSTYNGYCQTDNVEVTLKNSELWKKFHEVDTEMIITKNGRRMFPTLQIQVSHLDPLAQYCVLLELNPASRCRYKYSASGGWAPAGTEEAQSPQRIHLHPESPASGEYWMSQPISFGRLKLTNSPNSSLGHMVLSSMHKYQPKVIISKTSDPRTISWAPSTAAVFPETQFIAVTAYQNEKITKLKIDYNPFAKGFRENGQSAKRKRIESEDKENEDKGESDQNLEGTEKKPEESSRLTAEEDRLSPASSSRSDLQSPNADAPSMPRPQMLPETAPGYPWTNQYLPGSPYVYTYYPPYPLYVSSNLLTVCGPAYCNMYPAVSPVVPEDLSARQQKTQQVTKTRKLTDFSIRALTGCS